MEARLLRAAKTGNVRLLNILLQESNLRSGVPRNGFLLGTTVERNTALHVAAKLGHRSFAESFAKEAGSALSLLLLQQNSRGDSPLHCAARAGHEDLVSLFLEYPVKVELLQLKNRVQNTALHEAVLNDHGGLAVKLIEAHPDLATAVNKAGASPLYLAADRKLLDVVRWLLLRCPMPSHAGPNGQNALHAAVLRSHEITELILSEKPDLLREGDATGSTPLHYAASNGDLGMVGLLLNRDPSLATLKDKDGFSAIHVAASMGHLPLITLLIQRNPETIELVDGGGRNLVHIAIEKKRVDVVKLALETPELFDLVNEPDYQGNTPLHSAILERNGRIVHVLLEDKRVKTDVMNDQCLTPLDLATSSSQQGIALRMYKIMVELVGAGSRFSPQRLDQVRTKLRRNQEEDSNRYRTVTNNLAIMAVLIATVTFAAAFTLPGGYRGDQGTAVLARKWAFRVFLVSDAGGMVSAIVAACTLIYTGSQDHDVRLHSLVIAMRLVWVALGSMIVAFATGAYVVVAPESLWLGILICFIACSAVPLIWFANHWPTFNSRVTIKTTSERDKKGGGDLVVYKKPKIDDFFSPAASQQA